MDDDEQVGEPLAVVGEQPQPISLWEDPAEVIEKSRAQAIALLETIDISGAQPFIRIRGKRFLKFEGWQTIARFNKVTPITEWTKLVYDDDGKTAIAYEARVKLISIITGETIAAAEAMCGFDENVTQGQTKRMAKRNAARSMAQTRAASKAMRMAFAYIVVLADFMPQTAEEMEEEGGSNGHKEGQTKVILG